MHGLEEWASLPDLAFRTRERTRANQIACIIIIH
jgi:hypothetical protein